MDVLKEYKCKNGLRHRTNCIGEVIFRSIVYGEADVALGSGGGTEPITPIGVADLLSPTALNTVDDPTEHQYLFDKDRNGFIMGEGAGVLVLEEPEHAEKEVHIYMLELADTVQPVMPSTLPPADGPGQQRPWSLHKRCRYEA